MNRSEFFMLGTWIWLAPHSPSMLAAVVAMAMSIAAYVLRPKEAR